MWFQWVSCCQRKTIVKMNDCDYNYDSESNQINFINSHCVLHIKQSNFMVGKRGKWWWRWQWKWKWLYLIHFYFLLFFFFWISKWTTTTEYKLLYLVPVEDKVYLDVDHIFRLLYWNEWVWLEKRGCVRFDILFVEWMIYHQKCWSRWMFEMNGKILIEKYGFRYGYSSLIKLMISMYTKFPKHYL